MKITVKAVLFATLISWTVFLWGESSNIMINGDYLVYSYDHNYLFGRGNIIFSGEDFKIHCIQIEGDIKKGIVRLSGNCRIVRSDKEMVTDELVLDLVSLCGHIFTFADEIKKEKIHIRRPCPKFPEEGPEPKPMSELRQSLIYFEGREIHIRPNLDVIGINVTIFVEGIQSITFKKFKMNRGVPTAPPIFPSTNYGTTNPRAL